MTTKPQVEMHQQHREAQTELTSWLDDVYMWRAEHKQALAWLSQIEAAIHENDMKLQQHSSIIDKQERHIRQHEHEIAMQQQHDQCEYPPDLAEQHEEFNAIQTEARENHARIGDHHRKQMANLKRLVEAVTASMNP